MRKSHWWILVSVICLLAGLLVRREIIGRNYVSDLFGGATNLQTVRAPDNVQAWQTLGFLREGRTHGSGQADPKDFYAKGEVPVLVPKALAKRLSRLLLSAGSYYYHPGSQKMCVPKPGFVLTFKHGKQSLDVLICLECDILMVNAGGGFKSSADFDPSHNQMLRLIKSAFPNVGRVQGIPEKGRH